MLAVQDFERFFRRDRSSIVSSENFGGFWISSSTSIEVEVPGHWLLSSGRNREEVVELRHADQNAM